MFTIINYLTDGDIENNKVEYSNKKKNIYTYAKKMLLFLKIVVSL
jgi:hypothetical protein